MTDITERIARAIYPEAWKMEPSHEAEYAKARTVLDANTAVAVMERAGISKETIGKLINGEYVAVPVDEGHAVRQFAKLIPHGDEAHKRWLEDAAEQFIRDGTVPPMLAAHKEQLS
jgi:hypothetical protein